METNNGELLKISGTEISKLAIDARAKELASGPIILTPSIKTLTEALPEPLMRCEDDPGLYGLGGVPIYECEHLPEDWLAVMISPTGDEESPFTLHVLQVGPGEEDDGGPDTDAEPADGLRGRLGDSEAA